MILRFFESVNPFHFSFKFDCTEVYHDFLNLKAIRIINLQQYACLTVSNIYRLLTERRKRYNDFPSRSLSIVSFIETSVIVLVCISNGSFTVLLGKKIHSWNITATLLTKLRTVALPSERKPNNNKNKRKTTTTTEDKAYLWVVWWCIINETNLIFPSKMLDESQTRLVEHPFSGCSPEKKRITFPVCG